MNQPFYQTRYEIDPTLECFGDFDKSRALCLKHCALRLRCAIEQDHMLRMEMFEDWMAFRDDTSIIH